MPTFANMGKNWYSDTVPENIELHSPLSVQIQATSPMSRKLIYSIVKGNELEEFAVDFNTGMQRLFSFFPFLILRLRLDLKHFYQVFTLSTRKLWAMLKLYAAIPLPGNFTSPFHRSR